MRYRKILALLSIGVVLCACAYTNEKVATQTPINWTDEHGKKVLLIDPDVELSELTFGGVSEPRADWSTTAKGLVKTEIAAFMARKSIATASVEGIADPHEAQLVKLHGAVGNSIL